MSFGHRSTFGDGYRGGGFGLSCSGWPGSWGWLGRDSFVIRASEPAADSAGGRAQEAEADAVNPGDAILINGNLAEHGLVVVSVREGLEFAATLRSDVAPLNSLVSAVLAAGVRPGFMRDPTRGGLAALLVDIAEATGVTVEIEERSLPMSATARHAAELLGLDPLTVANEGKCVMVVAPEEAPRALAVLRGHPLGRQAAVIGRVTEAAGPAVELLTGTGGRRMVQRPYGEELPRIC